MKEQDNIHKSEVWTGLQILRLLYQESVFQKSEEQDNQVYHEKNCKIVKNKMNKLFC